MQIIWNQTFFSVLLHQIFDSYRISLVLVSLFVISIFECIVFELLLVMNVNGARSDCEAPLSLWSLVISHFRCSDAKNYTL